MAVQTTCGAVACLALGAVLLGAACERGTGSPADRPGAAAAVESVAPDGTRFDPPVPASRIPEDTWMCDMNGQVHYAAKNEGSGECPVCSMRLVYKPALETGE